MMARAEIVARALRLRRVRDGEWHGQCPSCGYKSGFCVTERDNRTLLYCAAGGCTQADLWAALTKAGLAASRESGEPYKARQPLSRAARKGPQASIWRLVLYRFSTRDGRPKRRYRPYRPGSNRNRSLGLRGYRQLKQRR